MGINLPTILALVGLVLLSAFFSACETAFSSLNRARVKAMANNGNRKAQRAVSLSEKYDRLLSTVLVGNNLVNIFSASIATVVFVKWLGEGKGVTLATALMTVIILIFGQISPKSLAKENAEAVAMALTPALGVFMKILLPVTAVFEGWKKLLGRVFSFDAGQTFTEDELMLIVDEAENDGGIDQDEGTLIRAAIEFNDLSAEDILTHRVDIAAVEDTASIDEIMAVFGATGYSRLPVYNDTIDNILGVVLEKDFYRALQAPGFQLKSIIKQPLFITKSAKISALMKQLQQSKSHMAIVVDEFGGTYGLVTLEDILEELVGDIWDEHDDVVEDIRPAGDNIYIVNCGADIDDLFEHFGIELEDYDAVTVGGWAMQELGKVPQVGDSFDFMGLRVKVIEVDQRRPVECEITVLPGEAGEREAV